MALTQSLVVDRFTELMFESKDDPLLWETHRDLNLVSGAIAQGI